MDKYWPNGLLSKHGDICQLALAGFVQFILQVLSFEEIEVRLNNLVM